MGDFNLDVLKFESHQDTNNFLNTLSSFFFQPQILQPTRITEHSATLIDNTFFNSLDHFVISGNLIYDLSGHLQISLLLQSIFLYHYQQNSTGKIIQLLVNLPYYVTYRLLTGMKCLNQIKILINYLISFIKRFQRRSIGMYQLNNYQRNKLKQNSNHG